MNHQPQTTRSGTSPVPGGVTPLPLDVRPLESIHERDMESKSGCLQLLAMISLGLTAFFSLYVVSPMDGLPDMLPLIGYVDDVLAAALALYLGVVFLGLKVLSSNLTTKGRRYRVIFIPQIDKTRGLSFVCSRCGSPLGKR